MKKILVLLSFCAALPLAYTQSPESMPPAAPVKDAGPDPAREATDLLIEKYSLDVDQAAKMYTIQQRKQQNLAEIQGFKQSNPALFRNKLQSIQRGTQASIRRLLRTQIQKEQFQQAQSEQRRLRAEKRRELLAQDVAPEDIELALLDIYIE